MKKRLIITLSILLAVLMVCSCETQPAVSEDSQESAANESSGSNPSHDKLPTAGETVKALNCTVSEPAVTYEGKELLFNSDLPKGITMMGGFRQEGGKIIVGSDTESSSMLIRTLQFSAERMVIELNLKMEVIPDAVPEDTSFTNPNDLLTLGISEYGRWFNSSYDYSTKLRICKADKRLKFYGYSESVSNENLVVKKNGDSQFGSNEDFNIRLVFEHEYCYLCVNGGKIDCYAPVDTLNDFMIKVRKGVQVSFSSIRFYGTKHTEYEYPKLVREMLDQGCFTGYVNSYATEDGVRLDRLTHEQFMGEPFMNLASSGSGVTLDIYTNSKNLELTYKVFDSIWSTGWEGGFDFYLNGELSKCANRMHVRNNVYRINYSVPDEEEGYNRITVYFPPCLSVALTDLRINEGAVYKPAGHSGTLFMFGDSITEGNSVQKSSSLYSNVFAREKDLVVYNQAVSGSIFSNYCVNGKYGDIKPDYILIAYGTNNYGDGSADYAYVRQLIREGLDAMLKTVKENFPQAKVICMLPLCRTGEEGANFTLKQTGDYIASLCDERGISWIDCHDMLPLEQTYFSDTMLHPNSDGSKLYGENLAKALENLIPSVKVDWKQKAAEAF